jgi:hypothetical protein
MVFSLFVAADFNAVGMSPKKMKYSPPPEEGWTRPQKNIAEGILE